MDVRVHEYDHVQKHNIPVQPPVTTVVLKFSGLHSERCIQKIRKIITTTKGVLNVAINRNLDTATVKGVMDAKALAEKLRNKMKREVEIIPPKKEKDGGEAKDKEGDRKNKKGGGCHKAAEITGGWGKVEGQRLKFQGACGYGQCVYRERTYPYYAPYTPNYAPAPYTPYYAPDSNGPYPSLHAPGMFSEADSNTCSVM